MAGAGVNAGVGAPNAWPMKLTRSENYQTRIGAISDALLVQNKLCLVDDTCVRESVTEPMHQRWDRCNAVVKSWIINSVSKDLEHGMHYNPTARSIWKDLRERFSKVDGTRIFHLHRDMYQMKQGTLSIT